MKISVITVCFNSGRTLGEALRSVRAQTHPQVEQVVVDGASTDDTLAVVASEGLPGLRLVCGPDTGIYDAMNKGLALASGEVLAFLNSDDHYASPEVLAHVAQALDADSDLDAVLGDVVFFDPARAGRPVRRYRSARFKPSLLAWGWMPAHPALFVRRRVFERVGNFRTDLRIAGDYDWIVRAFGPGTLRYRHLDEVMVRMRTGGISTGGWRNTLLLNREVLRACRDNGIRTNWWMLLSKYPAKLLEFVRP